MKNLHRSLYFCLYFHNRKRTTCTFLERFCFFKERTPFRSSVINVMHYQKRSRSERKTRFTYFKKRWGNVLLKKTAEFFVKIIQNRCVKFPISWFHVEIASFSLTLISNNCSSVWHKAKWEEKMEAETCSTDPAKFAFKIIISKHGFLFNFQALK